MTTSPIRETTLRGSRLVRSGQRLVLMRRGIWQDRERASIIVAFRLLTMIDELPRSSQLLLPLQKNGKIVGFEPPSKYESHTCEYRNQHQFLRFDVLLLGHCMDVIERIY
jgi:hypothetical protein